MKDLGESKRFLGNEILRNRQENYIVLHEKRYNIQKVLKNFE